MGVSWPYLKHHPGPQPAVLGHCWRNSASGPQAAAAEEEHSPTALQEPSGMVLRAALLRGSPRLPHQSVPSCRQQD